MNLPLSPKSFRHLGTNARHFNVKSRCSETRFVFVNNLKYWSYKPRDLLQFIGNRHTG